MKKKFFALLVVAVIALTSVFSLAACGLGGGTSNVSGGLENCEHVYGQYISDGNATCSKDGTKTAYCNKCHRSDTIPDEGSKLPHTFTSYTYDNNASCTQDGTKTAYCTVCHTAKDTVSDDRHTMRDHVFTEYKSDDNATCDTDGTKTAVCDTCKTATDTVKEAGTAGHTYVNGSCSVCHASHLTYKAAGDEYTVTGIAEDCISTEIVIPATENGKPIVSISDNAFKDNTTITKITLPDSVWLIGNGAFSGCTALESVTFGSGLTTIRYQAFAECTTLEHVSFPDSLRELGNKALAGCSSLKTVSFGKGLASLLDNCFDGCELLESVTFPPENPSFCNIGGMIYNGSKYAIVYVPHALSGKVAIYDGLTKISSTSFQNRTGITGIYIPKSVRSISVYAFSGCSSLTDIYYEGTEEEWNSMKKDNNWDYGMPDYTVHFNADNPDEDGNA